SGSARSTRYRRLRRTRTRQAPDSRERKNRRTADPTDAKEDRRWRLRNALPIEKASGGTGVRTDQTGTQLPPVPVAGRRESARRMGHHLHHPQPPEAVHPRKRRLSRLPCNKCPTQRPIWTGTYAPVKISNCINSGSRRDAALRRRVRSARRPNHLFFALMLPSSSCFNTRTGPRRLLEIRLA